MIHRDLSIALCAAIACCALRAEAQSRPATQTPTGTTPAGVQAITARVIEVNGDAQHRVDEGAWQPVKVNDEYGEMTQIRTGIGASVKLEVGKEEPFTAVVIDPVSSVILSEVHKTADTKRVRVGVGHGRIRAGVAEGGLKSDFTVDSPVATLSKKGTWNFGLFYERATDRFEMFLLDRGLVEAIHGAKVRELDPGEAVTQAMRRWADEAQLRRNVPVAELLGQDDLAIAFNRLRNDGLGVADPGSGRGAVLDIRNPDASDEFRNLVRDQLTTVPPILDINLPPQRALRPEGFFGSGRGDQLIPILISHNSGLARNGFAKPGVLTFRRSALEGFLKK